MCTVRASFVKALTLSLASATATSTRRWVKQLSSQLGELGLRKHNQSARMTAAYCALRASVPALES